MSCSTVVVVVAINVIAAGWEEVEEVLLLQVKICMCRFNYLDINCQRNDVPCVCVCVANSHAQAWEFCYCQQANHVGVHPVADCGEKRMLK